jgi:cellulose synthase/poly-beta-1,6-N-acetylglucosamine synthase-like glycosyltransferase
VLVLGVLLLASILTLAASAYVLLATPQVQKLVSLQVPAPTTWPRLSVVIPALNEVDTLEAALGTLLAETYPDLEIVLVDDRSTDGTGALVDRLAARDPRITPVHITALPEGWLGKVHALHVGTQHARGDWLLYTDADVHFGQGSLRHAVAVAEASSSSITSRCCRGCWRATTCCEPCWPRSPCCSS